MRVLQVVEKLFGYRAHVIIYKRKLSKNMLNAEETSSENSVKQKPKVVSKDKTIVIKGKPKSNRFWKTEKTKFSSIIKSRGLKSSFEKKQALREKLQRIKQESRERKAEKQEQEEQRKERRRENLKRREENQKKAEIVQVITNTKKLSKMKKKHLRNVEKRDTTIVSK